MKDGNKTRKTEKSTPKSYVQSPRPLFGHFSALFTLKKNMWHFHLIFMTFPVKYLHLKHILKHIYEHIRALSSTDTSMSYTTYVHMYVCIHEAMYVSICTQAAGHFRSTFSQSMSVLLQPKLWYFQPTKKLQY